MLHMKNWSLRLAKSGKQQGYIFCCGSAADQFHLAAGKVIVLNIYDNESLHAVPHEDVPLEQDFCGMLT